MNRALKALPILLALVASGCLVVFSRGEVERATREELDADRVVRSPMKAFFADGSVAVFPGGGSITTDSIVGEGTLYVVGMTESRQVSSLPLDSLVGVEAFHGEVNVPASVLGSVALTGVAALGSLALFKAIFGSCPTFYTTAEHGGELQAEGFSYSIAPLLEGRDLDATALAPSADGVLRLELRNEALETHYINHLDLLAVDHPPGTRVIPSDREVPLVVTAETDPSLAVDRAGRDVLAVLAAADDRVFSSTEERIRSARGDDPLDEIELAFRRPEGDQAVLVLRLRNSLLTTVLFYDMMLGRAGPRAVDWIGQDMARIGSVVELGRWFQESMGLRVEVHDGTDWVPAGRVPDTGPIAWEEVGVAIPAGDSETVRVRLRFLADAWRIDRVALGSQARLHGEVPVAVARVMDDGALMDQEVLQRLARPDDAYLDTYPGTSVMLEFDPPPERPGAQRSYLLRTQGYYTEWVRTEWLRSGGEADVFRPDESTVESLMSLWLDRKDSFEADFYRLKVPVR